MARFVGQVKAVASARLNKSGLSVGRFSWQNEYGVFSLDRKRLQAHVEYVDRQKEHHAEGTVVAELERVRGEGPNLQVGGC